MISFNKHILSFENQEFINNNLNSNLNELVLKGLPFETSLHATIIAQIEAKKRCEKKLPTWFKTPQIYYPNKLNIEQTSSETSAQFKSELISGENLIDLTGGFGVDDFYFSKQFKQIYHCEINEALLQIVSHNFKQLDVNNITFFANDGIEVLKELNKTFDWIYVDPSRRSDKKGKVFLLEDCEPNVIKHSKTLFKYSNNVLIKTSPILDLSSGLNELSHVKTIFCVAVNNEVKELLWVLEKEYFGETEIKTVNILAKKIQTFDFKYSEEKLAEAKYSEPLTYLYEPNAAILKTGAFNLIGIKYKLFKLHKHSHLYTSDQFIEFPGRRFKVIKQTLYNKKQFKRDFELTKANVTTRNFPESVEQIRKKLKLKDGGTDYLFFTTNLENKKIIVHSKKI